jgi:hypothetical protein
VESFLISIMLISRNVNRIRTRRKRRRRQRKMRKRPFPSPHLLLLRGKRFFFDSNSLLRKNFA